MKSRHLLFQWPTTSTLFETHVDVFMLAKDNTDQDEAEEEEEEEEERRQVQSKCISVN